MHRNENITKLISNHKILLALFEQECSKSTDPPQQSCYKHTYLHTHMDVHMELLATTSPGLAYR